MDGKVSNSTHVENATTKPVLAQHETAVEEKELRVENATLAQATKGLSPWVCSLYTDHPWALPAHQLTITKGKGYLKTYLCLAIISLASTMIGYDGSLMGSINALPSYTKYYGLPAEGSAGTGLVFAIFNVSGGGV